MNKEATKLINIFIRYLVIIILGISNLYIIYRILTPITIKTTNFIISIFTKTILIGNIIQFNQTTIEIIKPCVAGSAFYLLLVLLLSTFEIKPKVRLKAIATAVVTLFVINVARILLLATITTSPNFETIHWIFWHIVSIVLVVAIYIMTIKIYKIKSIPIISDIKYIKNLTSKDKRKKSK